MPLLQWTSRVLQVGILAVPLRQLPWQNASIQKLYPGGWRVWCWWRRSELPLQSHLQRIREVAENFRFTLDFKLLYLAVGVASAFASFSGRLSSAVGAGMPAQGKCVLCFCKLKLSTFSVRAYCGADN